MSVKSFECAIARGQIGRYLAGDPVGDEAMRQLEAHIAGCEGCGRLVESKRRELLGPLANAPTAAEAIAPQEEIPIEEDPFKAALRAAARTGRAVVAEPAAVVAEHDEWAEPLAVGAKVPVLAGAHAEMGASEFSANDAPASPARRAPKLPKTPKTPKPPKPPRDPRKLPAFSLPKLTRPIADEPDDEPTPSVKVAKPPLTKALVYGGALAIVLGAMSFLGDPTALFGPRATPVATKAKPKAEAAAKPAAKPKLAAGAPAGAPKVIAGSLLGVPIAEEATRPQSLPKTAVALKGAGEDPAEALTESVGAGDPFADPAPAEATPAKIVPAKAKPRAAKPAAPKPIARKPIARKPILREAAPKAAAPKVIAPKPTAKPAGPQVAVARNPALEEIQPPEPAATKPAASKPAPKPLKRKPIRRPATKRAPAPKSAPSIQVYDETGKPLTIK